MKKSTFIANVVVWGILAAASIAFLIWANSVNNEFDENSMLLVAAVYARPVAAFSVGALITTVLVNFFKLKLGRTAKIVWRVLGIVPTLLFAVSPFAIPYLPEQAATVFAVTLIVAMAIPVLFVLFGALYGLSLAGLKPAGGEAGEDRGAEAAE
ncbi:hypothetical protein [Paratractidigestivibacter sp.]|uniref:hypothetical protein n=1 Tax=Paratractidigestivibacter sp. TaxID=2847316 RepID=UPI002AC9CDED|nr:hypothetical protein [Paratractidigestivibacter sp.]